MRCMLRMPRCVVAVAILELLLALPPASAVRTAAQVDLGDSLELAEPTAPAPAPQEEATTEEEDKEDEVADDEPPEEPSPGSLTPKDDGVACEKLRFFRKRLLVTSQPEQVKAMLKEHGLQENYTNMTAELLDNTRLISRRWNIPALHSALWGKGKKSGWYALFRGQGVEVMLRRRLGTFDSELSLCFIDLSKHPEPVLDYGYRDARSPGTGKVLPPGVVAVLLTPTIYGNQSGKIVQFDEKDRQTTDMNRFVAEHGLQEAHKKLQDKVHIALSEKNIGDDIALALLEITVANESEFPFRTANVQIIACYKKRKWYPWRRVADTYDFWIEYADMSAHPLYLPSYAIMQERECEVLPSPKYGMTLEVKALMLQHDLEGKYRQMHRTLRLLFEEQKPQSADPIYRTLWNEGYDDYFNESGIKLYLSPLQDKWQLCYQDLTKIPGEDLPMSTYIDGKTVANSAGTLKDLSLGALEGAEVVGEELLETGQKLVFQKQTPVDVMRLLSLRGAAELHQEMTVGVKSLPPSPYGSMAEDLHSYIKKEFKDRFRVNSVGVYVCSRMVPTTHMGNAAAFMYFNWVEYVDLTVSPAYLPAERVPDASETGEETFGRKEPGSAHPQSGCLVAKLCIVAFFLLGGGTVANM